MRTQRKYALKAVAGAALAVLAMTGCASSSKPAASSAATGGTAAAAAAASGPAVVATADGAMGAFLTDGAGRSLYLWLGDPSSTSMCTGQCATYWPPLLTSGAPTAKGMADSKLVSTSKRDDGTTQVTYAGHPVYYFSGDKTAGATNGQGQNAFGYLWWVVSPAGAGITSAGSSGGSSPSATAPAVRGY